MPELNGLNYFSAANPAASPGWDLAKGSAMAGLFSSCSGVMPAVQGALTAVQSALPTSGQEGGEPSVCLQAVVPLGQVCQGSDEVPSIPGDICSMVVSNPNFLRDMQAQIKQDECTLACEKNQIMAIQNELQCFTSQAQQLKNQIASLNSLFTSNIQRMQQDMVQINSALANNEQESAVVETKLEGDPKTGKPGLNQMRADLLASVSAMPAEIQSLNQASRDVTRKQTILNEQIQTRKMALTMDCFNTRNIDTFHCSSNGPAVSASAYLLCRYEQTLNLGPNGARALNAQTAASASEQAGALKTLLDEISADTPQDASMPTTPEQAATSGQQTTMILSAADVINKYGSQLSNYKMGGTDAQQFMLGMLDYCQNRADSQVQSESNRTSSTIGQGEYAITNDQQALQQKIQQDLINYSQGYAVTMSALTGAPGISLNIQQCQNVPADQEIGCLHNIQSALQGVLSGSNNANVSMVIQGNNPQSNINFNCQGLNGCIQALQNVSTNLKSQGQQLTQFKTQYVNQAMQSTKSFVQNIASQMNVQSTMLQQKMTQLNSALGVYGMQGIPMGPGPTEQLEPDPDHDGLPKQPQSAYGVIAGYVNPPLPDLSGDGLQNATTSVGSMLDKLSPKEAALRAALVNIMNQGPACKTQIAQNMIQDLNQQAYGLSYCHQHFRNDQTLDDNIEAMYRAASNLGQVPGLSMGSTTALQTGISSFEPDAAYDSNLVGQNGPHGAHGMMGMGMSSTRGACRAYMSGLINTDKYLGSVGAYGGFNGNAAGSALIDR